MVSPSPAGPPASPSRPRRGRLARRASLLAVTSLAAASAAAPAEAAPTHHFYAYYDAPASAWQAGEYGNDTSGSTYTLTVSRGGTTIASDSEPYEGPAASVPGAPRAGDTLTFSRDGSVVASTALDGTPTIAGDACAGSSRFSGAATAGATVHAGIVVGNYQPSNTATVTTSGATYAAALARPLAASDRVFAEVTSVVSGGAADLDADLTQPVAASCPAPPAPPAPAPQASPISTSPSASTLTTTTIVKALDKTLGKLGAALTGLDPRALASKGSVTITTSVPSAGTLTITLTAPATGASAAKAKKAKTIVVARGSKTAAGAGTAKVKLKVTTAGKRLLNRVKKVKLTVVATFKAKARKAVTQRKAVTIKRHKAKAKKH